MGLKTYLVRWQEHYLWLPLIVALSIFAWVVLGALDRTATTDMMALLVELPMRSAYAVVALALAHLARRRQRRRLSDDDQRRLWDAAVAGHKGALLIYLTDVFVWLVITVMLLLFFWPAH